ncbi:MAG: hypothetical protein A2W03_16345 [Candidatus Aminicenantes bacterium RBG_16_63_16]|nr:MAG: hypothetical protein A2W03_16345 [Candidatus Aminicenantes bacterium RBG_16_63_16]
MAVQIIEKTGDIKIYGAGSFGGKGAGLIEVNEIPMPRVSPLKTIILATDFYDRYLENDNQFPDDDLVIVRSILEEMGTLPLGIRSSATNEAGGAAMVPGLIHAGENASFMLPNNHPDWEVRVTQTVQAIRQIYEDFLAKQPEGSAEKMAIVFNPIPGIFDDTLAGPVYYPYISGVATSFFPYALKNQDPQEGFARIAFGHGYATVLDDFPVISMATIRNPIPLNLLRIGRGQQYFYALDMTKNSEIRGLELETMRRLHVRFADYHRIRLLGLQNNLITIEELVQNDHFDFKTGLGEIMEKIARGSPSHFQIEFVFNLDFLSQERGAGIFHIVQLTRLPELKFERLPMPQHSRHTYLEINNAQGHGVVRGIKFALVISPFVYAKEMQAGVRRRIAEVNREMKARREKYIMLVPGRLGSKNPDWGIFVEYQDVDQAAAIFEYGVDVAGRAEPLTEEENLTGGTYGSHFLYMIQGGFDEDQKRLQTRMYGTQGTHFLTNLMSNNVIYGFIMPMRDVFDPWLWTCGRPEVVPSLLTFPRPVTVYADFRSQRCGVMIEND